ncbi:UNVERIFIED_CONTAM: hypothetical protein FKN15_039408 [Acipenser sinensis]
MNTRCPPKCVPSAARFFTLCRLTVQLPQSYSVGGQRSSRQLTGKPAGAWPDYRGRWCAVMWSDCSHTIRTGCDRIQELFNTKEAKCLVLIRDRGTYRKQVEKFPYGKGMHNLWQGKQDHPSNLNAPGVTLHMISK